MATACIFALIELSVLLSYYLVYKFVPDQNWLSHTYTLCYSLSYQLISAFCVAASHGSMRLYSALCENFSLLALKYR